jgi:tetratricopeptide (TPR) repeat protein
MQFYYEFLTRRRGPKEAEAVIGERLEMRRKRNADGEEVHMEVLGHHVAALNRIGRCAEGEIEGRQAVALAERLYPGENDPRVARVQAWLGESLVCLKRYDEAEAILLRCYELQNAATGLPKRDAPLVATILAQLYDRSGKPDEAQRWAARGPR